MTHTLVCVHGFRMLLDFVLSAKSTTAKYTYKIFCDYSNYIAFLSFFFFSVWMAVIN